MIKPTNTRVNWRATKYKNIMVSDTGEVWNYRLGRTVKNKSRIGLSPLVNVEKSSITIAKLVYQTFVGEIPEGFIVVHKDNIIENNFVGNLKLMRRSEHQGAFNRTNGIRVEVLDDDGELRKRYSSIKEFCKKNRVHKSTVLKVRKGEIKTSLSVPENVQFYRRKSNHELMKGE